jgi:hypothetical protein
MGFVMNGSISMEDGCLAAVPIDLTADQQYAHWEREALLPATQALLETLPFDLYPYATARGYPHVLNVLAMHWRNQTQFIQAASAFLHSKEWPRQGFPRLVFFELLSLVSYQGALVDLGELDLRHLNLNDSRG